MRQSLATAARRSFAAIAGSVTATRRAGPPEWVHLSGQYKYQKGIIWRIGTHDLNVRVV